MTTTSLAFPALLGSLVSLITSESADLWYNYDTDTIGKVVSFYIKASLFKEFFWMQNRVKQYG